MARRHKFSEPKKPFDDAFERINNMERNVCYRTVTADFTILDVVQWLYDEEVLAKLRAAYPLTGEMHPDRSEVVDVADPRLALLDAAGLPPIGTFEIRFDCDMAMICTPRQGLLSLGLDKRGIIPALFQYERIHYEFEIVRKVVRWFNEHGTPGAARHFFPAIGNFLSQEHPYFKTSGQHFTGTKRSISEIASDVRKASEIVVAGLLAGTVDREANSVHVYVVRKDSSKSQCFALC